MTSALPIEMVSDVVCPWCFIGKRRFERALADAPKDIEVLIAWRPYQLNPEMPPAGMERKAYLASKFGGDARADEIYKRVSEAGASEGIAFNFAGMQRTPNTIDAHRLIGLAGRAGRQDAVVEGLFRAYFLEGRDIGSADELATVAKAAGLDEKTVRDYLAGRDDVTRVENEDAVARRMGIQGVPCFIFNRKYAISGAQEPAVFLEALELIKREAAGEPMPARANS